MKIMSFSDLHLDSPFTSMHLSEQAERRELLLTVFGKIMSLSDSEKIDLLVIAGDLFDVPNISAECERAVSRMLSSIKIPIVIAPGNHDYYTEGGIFDKMPENVYVFKSETLETLYVEPLKLAIDGYAFTSREYSENPIVNYKPADEGYTHILVAHTSFTHGDGAYAPFTSEDLLETDYTFAFLGHVHSDTETYKSGETLAAFSGIPQGRSIDECISGGVRIVEIQNKEVIFNELLTVNIWNNTIAETDVTGIASDAELFSKIKTELSLLRPLEYDIIRILLVGEHGLYYVPNEAFILKSLQSLFGGVIFSIKNKALPEINKEELLRDPTIVGTIYRSLFEKTYTEGEYDQDTKMRAFRLALAALRGDTLNPDTV